jgi:hypothetical protein
MGRDVGIFDLSQITRRPDAMILLIDVLKPLIQFAREYTLVPQVGQPNMEPAEASE